MDDLIRRAVAAPDDDPLYVVAIGAITNVAAALLLEPDLVRKIVVVWWVGTHHQPSMEFNLMQDRMPPSQYVNSGVAVRPDSLLTGFARLLTTRSELDETIKGRNAISDFSTSALSPTSGDPFAWAKEIWDTIAYLLDELHADRNSTKPSNT